MTATRLFIWIAICFAFCGYVLLAFGENRGHYGVCGIFGTIWAVIALLSAIKDAKGIKFPIVPAD